MKAKDVLRLFEMFEDDMEDRQLTDSEKVKGIVKEVDDRRVWDLWKTLDGYDKRDYMEFKESVLKFYLGSKKMVTYLFEQLKELSQNSRDQRMSLAHLARYHSCFKPMALGLEDNDIISMDDMDEYFWTGLPKYIRRLVRQDLDMPSKKEFPSMKQAFRSARRVIQAMFDEEGNKPPFSFCMVTESVSSSEELEELANVPVNEEEKEDLALEVIVQAAGDVVSAIDKVVWAADEVRAIDAVECAADVFVRAVDEKTL